MAGKALDAIMAGMRSPCDLPATPDYGKGVETETQ
jgi:hypothetical protein